MRLLLCVGAVLVLAGCNEPPDKTVFDPQVQALKKARALEGQVRQAAEQRRANEELPAESAER